MVMFGLFIAILMDCYYTLYIHFSCAVCIVLAFKSITISPSSVCLPVLHELESLNTQDKTVRALYY